MQKPGNGNNNQTNTAMGDAFAEALNKQAPQGGHQDPAGPLGQPGQPGQVNVQQPLQPQAPIQPQPVQPTAPAFQPQFTQPGYNNVNQNNQYNNGQQPQQQAPQSRLFGMNTVRRRTFSTQDFSENFRVASETVTKFLEEGFKEDGYGTSFYVIPMQRPNLHCAALLYVGTYNAGGKALAFAFTMMLENTSSPLKPFSGNDRITNERFEIPRMTGSQYDDLYWAAVMDEVKNKLGQGVKVMDAGATVIKSEMDWEDKSAINKMLNNAENATIASANRFSKGSIERPLNLKEEINPQVDRITLGFNFNTQPLKSYDGMPIRNDVEIKMSITAEGAGQIQTAEPFIVVNGYVELNAATPQQIQQHQQMLFGQNQMMFQMNPQMASQIGFYTPRYYPQFTITNTSTGISNAEGMEFQLLSLYASFMITTGGTWMHAFAPKMVNDLDIGDIGAINYELGIGVDPNNPELARPKKLETHDSSFTTQSLTQLMTQACFQEMSIARDIEETGHRSWVDSALLQAGGIPGTSAGQLTDVGKAAHQSIIDSANNLTGGEFAKFWTDPNKLIVVRDGSRIPNGYYTNKSGQRLDSRNVDLLAVLNFVGDSDPRLVEEWKMINSATSGMTVEKRTALHNQYLQRFMGEAYVQKSYMERVVLTGDFIQALVAACHSAGLIVSPENTNTQYNSASYGTPLASMYGLSTQTVNPMFGMQQQQFQPQQGYGQVWNGVRTPYGTYRG